MNIVTNDCCPIITTLQARKKFGLSMEDEKLFLKWNDFQEHARVDFNEQTQKAQFTIAHNNTI